MKNSPSFPIEWQHKQIHHLAIRNQNERLIPLAIPVTARVLPSLCVWQVRVWFDITVLIQLYVHNMYMCVYYDQRKKMYEHLPMTVKLIFKFRVGELRKSTRHRYIPSSDSLILSTFNCAGRFAVLKKARDPNTVGDDHSFACPIGRPRTSKLWKKNTKSQ